MNNYSDPYRQLEVLSGNVIDAVLSLLITVLTIILIAVAIIIAFRLAAKVEKLKRGKLDITIGKYSVCGITFGKVIGPIMAYSKYNREGHVLAMGGSGTGKTSALLIPSLDSWDGSSFTIDISGDIEKNTHMDDKLIYEPEAMNTVPYNVFYAIDKQCSDADKNQALEKLAFLLMPDLPPQEASANARFYNDEGRKILTASLIAFYHNGYDFIDICTKIMESNYKQLFSEIDNTGNELAIRYINSFDGAPEQNTAGCKQSADAAIKLFATNHYVMNSVRRPRNGEESFTPDSIENNNVFFIVNDSRLDVYSPLVHLVVAQVLEYFSNRSNAAEHNILLCLDELASFGKLELVGALRKLRKKKVRIFCLTQSLADLNMIYGHEETKAMLNNFAYKVVLSASDTETQEYFTKLIGHKDVSKSFYNRLLEHKGVAIKQKEYAIEPEALGYLGNKLILLYPGGYVKLRKKYYFK